jgi:hypothetical protein
MVSLSWQWAQPNGCLKDNDFLSALCVLCGKSNPKVGIELFLNLWYHSSMNQSIGPS